MIYFYPTEHRKKHRDCEFYTISKKMLLPTFLQRVRGASKKVDCEFLTIGMKNVYMWMTIKEAEPSLYIL